MQEKNNVIKLITLLFFSVVLPETGKKLNGLQTFFGADISSSKKA
jgi:hypothetical protein